MSRFPAPLVASGAAQRLTAATVTGPAYAEAVSRVAALTHRSTDEVSAHLAAARRPS